MKLNPPASSSDLELARQIARRLHQQRRREDHPGTAEDFPSRARRTPPPLPPRGAPEPPPARTAPEPPPARTAPEPPPPAARPGLTPPAHLEAPPLPRSPAVEPERAEPTQHDAPPAPESVFEAPETPQFEPPAWSEPAPAPEPESLEDLAPPAEPSFEVEVDEPVAPPSREPELPGIDVDEPALSPEEMVGEAQDSPLDNLTDPGDSPFGDELLDAPAVAEEVAPPSWEEIAEACLGLAQAGGAMLADPGGRVFAAMGDWPAPGPEAIAAKLVAMMAKTLKDAPTRSISAPLMGMHLTAWRVPREEGLVTAAFIGRAPVRADARPAIDAEILKGPAA